VPLHAKSRPLTFGRDLPLRPSPRRFYRASLHSPRELPRFGHGGESAYEAPHYHRRVRRIRAVILLYPELFRYLDRVPDIPESVSLTQCLQAGGPPVRAVTFDPQPANGMRYIGLHRIRAASSAGGTHIRIPVTALHRPFSSAYGSSVKDRTRVSNPVTDQYWSRIA